MSENPDSFCDHCHLPLGQWPHAGEAEGATGQFCCYGCFIGWQTAHGGGDDAVAAAFLIRLGLGAFLAMNIMLFSLLLYSGALDGIDTGLRPYIHILLWVLATPVLTVLGGPFFKEAFTELLRGRLAPSLLIVIGTSAAYAYSAIATLQGADRIYFDTVTMVLVFFTLGRYLEASGRARAARSLQPLLEAEHQLVRCHVEGQDMMCRLAAVTRGTLVRIWPGERIPVDGVVVEGVSQTEEAMLTGESRPVAKLPGSPVLAGSINGDGDLLIEASADGLESRWIAICCDVRAALSRPTQAQRVAEKVAQVFIPLVILIAAATVWTNWQLGAGDMAFLSGLAVLVVACPCALGLAAPLATSLAVAHLTRNGVLIRSGAVLETLAGIRAVAFDKTGTLTQSNIRYHEMASAQAKSDTVFRYAAAIASHSHHPLSRALCNEASRKGHSAMQASSVQIVTGKGAKGTVRGQCVLVGSRRWLEAEGLRFPSKLEKTAGDAAVNGRMLVFAGWGEHIRGVFAFDDAVHPQAKALIGTLKQQGLKPLVLSGDGETQTERLCTEIGVDQWHGELLPGDKQNLLKQIANELGPVAMVGDGVNDAPAMTQAAIGIAVGEGTGIARETAGIVLPPGGIAQLPELLETARRTKRTIVANLAWAFGYNGIAVVLATLGLLQPVIAAALMAGSSLFVVVNTIAKLGSNYPRNAPNAFFSGSKPANA